MTYCLSWPPVDVLLPWPKVSRVGIQNCYWIFPRLDTEKSEVSAPAYQCCLIDKKRVNYLCEEQPRMGFSQCATCTRLLNSVFTKQLVRGRSRVCAETHGKQCQSTPQNHTELNVKASVFSKDTPVSKLKLRSVFAFSNNVHTWANTYQKRILHDTCISLNTSYQNKIWHFVCVNITANGMWVAALAIQGLAWSR